MSFFDNIEETMDKQAAVDKEASDSPKFDPNPGDTLQAVLLKAEAFTGGQYAPTPVITVRNVGKEDIGGIEAGRSGYMFAGTVLRRKLLEMAPAIGAPLAIRYEGMVTPTSGGNPFKDWTVIISDEDRGLWKNIAEMIAGATSAPSVVRSQNAQPTDSDWKF